MRLAEMVTAYLTPHGFSFAHAESIADAKTIVSRDGVDAFSGAILDVMLPDGDGFDFLRWLRQQDALPVLMLTARGDAMDRVVGLELGADDYLPKPFEPRELLARLRAILRRSSGARSPRSTDVLRFGELEIDRAAHRVTTAGVDCPLTGHQFALLAALTENAGRVMSREQLMRISKGPLKGTIPVTGSVTVRTRDDALLDTGDGAQLTLKAGRSVRAMPLLEPSKSETWVSTAFAGRLAGSTAKPWFIETISTLPVVLSCTGWLAP